MTERRSDPLDAVSPLDGRYADRTAPLVPYASESGLMRARLHVEVEYLLALSVLPGLDLDLTDADRDEIRGLVDDFDAADARSVKRIETTGTDDYPATNHDVKAVEYFIREHLPDRLDIDHWIHFGLTSEDVNNLAYRILVRDALESVVVPTIDEIGDRLASAARSHRAVPMLARTHGQPATPTTYGKELAVYADRLDRARARLDRGIDGLSGKLAGASGTYAAHVVAAPTIDWPSFSARFVTDLGFRHAPLTTQVNPSDDLAEVFDALRGLNNVLIDLDVDMWLYVSQGYLTLRAPEGETGSSTMPHKVNPIDFENSEGNLEKANSDLVFLADSITRSRLQRDLSDSTVRRNIGAALAHCLLGYTKCLDGLESVAPDDEALRRDLEAEPSVLAEAVQTVLRAAGAADAYEVVKSATRGRTVTIDTIRAIVDDADLDPETADRLRSLTPGEYTGRAADLVDELDE